MTFHEEKFGGRILKRVALADKARYDRQKEPETADNVEMLQVEQSDQGADNTTPACLLGFANGINCYENPIYFTKEEASNALQPRMRPYRINASVSLIR